MPNLIYQVNLKQKSACDGCKQVDVTASSGHYLFPKLPPTVACLLRKCLFGKWSLRIFGKGGRPWKGRMSLGT